MRREWGFTLWVIGCDSEPETLPDSSTTTTVVEPSSSSSTAQTATSSGAEPNYRPTFSICRKQCELAADCCPADQAPCPTLEYPGNYGCVDGLCTPPQCVDDSACEAQRADSTCEWVEGTPQCVVLCMKDEECAPLGTSFACAGLTAEGLGYCRERCDLGPMCLLETCSDAGICICSDDSDCINGFSCDQTADE